jgi:hypothetical protein
MDAVMADVPLPPRDPYWPFPPWPNLLDSDDESTRAAARAAATSEEQKEAEIEAETSRLSAKYLELQRRPGKKS